MNARRSVITMVMLAAAGRGWSQPIYRCGSNYSDRPCADGRTIESDDGRTHAQARQAETAARTDARLAREMESQRLRAEALAEKNRAAPSSRTRAAPAAWTEMDDEDWPPEPGHRDPRTFVARVPGTGTKKPVSRSTKKKDPAPAQPPGSPAPVR